MNGDRPPEQIRRRYLIERELAERLRNASREDRRVLYSCLYDELFSRVPDHPLLTRKADKSLHAETLFALSLLKRFIRADTTFLEIGAGDCALAARTASLVREVFAIDVANEIAGDITLPANCELIISDGCSIPVPAGSISLAFSDQLMEHLHPDDALTQLKNIYNALAPNGVYICLTPNKLSGPHDISRYFDEVATGLHLREYTTAELARLFKSAGFKKLNLLIGARGYYATCPVMVIEAAERVLVWLNRILNKNIARGAVFRILLGIRLVGRK